MAARRAVVLPFPCGPDCLEGGGDLVDAVLDQSGHGQEAKGIEETFLLRCELDAFH